MLKQGFLKDNFSSNVNYVALAVTKETFIVNKATFLVNALVVCIFQ